MREHARVRRSRIRTAPARALGWYQRGRCSPNRSHTPIRPGVRSTLSANRSRWHVCRTDGHSSNSSDATRGRQDSRRHGSRGGSTPRFARPLPDQGADRAARDRPTRRCESWPPDIGEHIAAARAHHLGNQAPHSRTMSWYSASSLASSADGASNGSFTAGRVLVGDLPGIAGAEHQAPAISWCLSSARRAARCCGCEPSGRRRQR